MWILIFTFLLIYLYLTTNSLWDLFVGFSLMILILCFLNDWNIEQLLDYVHGEIKPIIKFFNEKMKVEPQGVLNE